MTGVYISEVCLIGLFAINTAPGPLVLMIVYLIATAIYHAMMRNALRPLMMYLPSSLDSDDQLAMFDHSDIHSYDSSKSDHSPCSAEHTVTPKKMATRKAGLFSKVFDPRKSASHQSVHALVPHYPPPKYLDDEESRAYFNPVVTTHAPRLWIVRDEMGISTQEVKDSSEVVEISDEFARFDEKGKVAWDVERLDSVPVYEKRIDY